MLHFLRLEVRGGHGKEVSVPAAVEKITRGSFKNIIVDLLVCLELAD